MNTAGFRKLAPVFASVVLLSSAALGAGDPVDARPPTLANVDCLAFSARDGVAWCLAAFRTAAGYVVQRIDRAGKVLTSASLPLPGTLTLRQEFSLVHAGGSLWLGCSGHPFVVLRLDPATLAVTGQFPLASGRFSRTAGSTGSLTAGRDDHLWALTNKRLFRIDPRTGSAEWHVDFPDRPRGILARSATVWVGQENSLLKINAATGKVIARFRPPAGFRIASSDRGGFIVEYAADIWVGLSTGDRFWSGKASYANGRVDETGGRIVPSPWPAAESCARAVQEESGPCGPLPP